ncbi:tripartite tricarboxylate transporter substrate binding protein [Amaricoccus sp.]|uniref:Bug family tripartite tricarboxylate transporter substrate binding protein n=1 Tax=Amaricoccus sp. TaxID=1872485 RepID=UPI002BC42B00|nr:tripartite tricarboxylate transporter substrate binding protein [Amaricoccus sp.]HMR60183.1 tripartite tricarboxylate transporter substrate binding protein [Amaricoccus sp.]
MKLNRRTLLGAGAAALALATAPMASAEPGSWSSEPVRIVVTFPPGGTSDLAARLLAQHLDTDYGQKAVVDNRPGAAGTVAADYVAQQEPDGTTLILSNNAPFTIAPTRFASIPYDTMGDFTHIAYIGASSPGLFVQPSSGITTVDEYIAASKENPLAYGSSGVGTISHILGVAVDRALGTESIHVPYQGSTPAIQDFRAGVLDTFYDMVVQNTEMIEDNEAVAIAIASPERNPEAPEVPTFLEQGYDVVLENWVGLSGPAGMDPEMTQTIHDTVLAIFSDPEVVARLTELGIPHTAMSSEEYTDFVAKQIEVWAPLIEAAGIKE